MSIKTDERFAAIIEQEQIRENEKEIAETDAIRVRRQQPKHFSFTPRSQPSRTLTGSQDNRQLQQQESSQTRQVIRELGLSKERHSTDHCGAHGPGTCCRSDEDRLAGRRPPAIQRYSHIIVATRLAIFTCFAVGLTAATARACWFLITTALL